MTRSRPAGVTDTFAPLFEWLFVCRLDWLFGIEWGGNRVIPLEVDDRGRASLPTSPRPIEVWL